MCNINIQRKRGLGDLICSLAVVEHIKRLNPKIHLRVFSPYSTLKQCVPYAEMLPIQFAPSDCLVLFSNNLYEKTLQEAYWDSVMNQLNWNEKYEGQIQKLYPKRVINLDKGIGIFLKSSQKFREYPFMKELVQILRKLYKVYVFDSTERVDGAINLTNLDIDTMVSIVAQTQLIISPDSAGIHIAGALGIPVLGLFGATDPQKRIVMYPNSHYIQHQCVHQPCWYKPKCIMGDDYTFCMKQIQVEEIVTKVNDFMPIRNKTKILKEDGDVAVIRIRGLGDVLMCWFPLEALTQKGVKVDFYTSPEASMLFYGQNDLVYRVIPIHYNHHTLNMPVPLPKELSGKKYRKIYNLMNAVDFGENAYRQARVKNFAEMLNVDIRNIPLRKLCVPDDMVRFAQSFGRYVCIQVDADGMRRQYPLHYWQKVINGLSKRLPYKIVLVGKKSVFMRGCINLTGKTNIMQYIALVCYAEVFIGTDSSGLHIRARSPYRNNMVVLLGNTGKSLDNEFAHLYLYDISSIYILEAKRCSRRPCWDIGNCQKLRCLYSIKPKSVVKGVMKVVGNSGLC